jgi:hypothetical protein
MNEKLRPLPERFPPELETAWEAWEEEDSRRDDARELRRSAAVLRRWRAGDHREFPA